MTQATPFRGVSTAVLPKPMPGRADARSFGALIRARSFGCSRGAILTFEGDASCSVYYVISGWLAKSKFTADGHRQIVEISLPGDLLSPEGADPGLSAVQVEALTDTKYARIPRQEWLRFLAAHPEVDQGFDRKAAAAVSRMSERILRLGKGSAESRIAYALCELCLLSSPRGLLDQGTFHIPMSQQQLGDYCGLSAVHVCRTLRRFKRNGIIDVSARMDVVIQNIDALAGIAEVDPDTLPAGLIPAA